jgi:hypothetical protein
VPHDDQTRLGVPRKERGFLRVALDLNNTARAQSLSPHRASQCG